MKPKRRPYLDACTTFVPQDDPRYPERFVPDQEARAGRVVHSSSRWVELEDARSLLPARSRRETEDGEQ